MFGILFINCEIILDISYLFLSRWQDDMLDIIAAIWALHDKVEK